MIEINLTQSNVFLFVRVFKRSGFVQSGSFLNTRDGWEQRFNLASWKSQCPRKPWENLSWETCQTQRMATWMERYVPSAKRRRWRYDYISDYECIFNHPLSHAGNKQEYWKKLQDAKTRLGGTTMQIGTLSKDVFERRTSTGSEAFSLSICLDANKLVLYFNQTTPQWCKKSTSGWRPSLKNAAA